MPSIYIRGKGTATISRNCTGDHIVIVLVQNFGLLRAMNEVGYILSKKWAYS